MLALLDERLGDGGDRIYGTVQPKSGVDAVSKQVSSDAAPRNLNIETPQPFAALGQILRNPDGGIAWLRIGLRIHKPLKQGK